jgi:2',3'-cyclic-nucleotide 2'-phosphodiesterase
MRLLFLGDVLGRSGRAAVCERLPALRKGLSADFVIVNGENAAGGFGITEQIFQDLRDAGADAVTTGNHVWDQRDTMVFITRQNRLLRPLNYPPGTPGAGCGLFRAENGADVLVMNVLGRIFMDALDDPFQAVEREISACPLKHGADAIFIDIHAEATSEKQALAAAFDGRVTAVIGTHTHVPTADARIMPGGTAFLSDVGMCGDYDSIIGMDKSEPVHRFTTRIPSGRFTPALGPATICGVLIETEDATGLAVSIEPVREGAPLGGGSRREGTGD